MQENPGIRQLKEILLTEERGERERLVEEVENLREELMLREKLEPKVGPLIEDRLNYLQEHFPEIYGKVITETIKKQIRDSRDEVVEALYPIVGRLIQRFVRKEIEVLSARVDDQVNRLFSLRGWWDLLLGQLGIRKVGDQVIRNAVSAQLQQVFLIDKRSGLLLGQWARVETADPDMVAAMMTAIQAFAQDALGNSSDNLASIEYESMRLCFLPMHTSYFAVLVSGVMQASYESRLTEALWAFAEHHMKESITEITGEVNRSYSEWLRQEFSQFDGGN